MQEELSDGITRDQTEGGGAEGERAQEKREGQTTAEDLKDDDNTVELYNAAGRVRSSIYMGEFFSPRVVSVAIDLIDNLIHASLAYQVFTRSVDATNDAYRVAVEIISFANHTLRILRERLDDLQSDDDKGKEKEEGRNKLEQFLNSIEPIRTLFDEIDINSGQQSELVDWRDRLYDYRDEFETENQYFYQARRSTNTEVSRRAAGIYEDIHRNIEQLDFLIASFDVRMELENLEKRLVNIDREDIEPCNEMLRYISERAAQYILHNYSYADTIELVDRLIKQRLDNLGERMARARDNISFGDDVGNWPIERLILKFLERPTNKGAQELRAAVNRMKNLFDTFTLTPAAMMAVGVIRELGYLTSEYRATSPLELAGGIDAVDASADEGKISQIMTLLLADTGTASMEGTTERDAREWIARLNEVEEPVGQLPFDPNKVKAVKHALAILTKRTGDEGFEDPPKDYSYLKVAKNDSMQGELIKYLKTIWKDKYGIVGIDALLLLKIIKYFDIMRHAYIRFGHSASLLDGTPPKGSQTSEDKRHTVWHPGKTALYKYKYGAIGKHPPIIQFLTDMGADVVATFADEGSSKAKDQPEIMKSFVEALQDYRVYQWGQWPEWAEETQDYFKKGYMLKDGPNFPSLLQIYIDIADIHDISHRIQDRGSDINDIIPLVDKYSRMAFCDRARTEDDYQHSFKQLLNVRERLANDQIILPENYVISFKAYKKMQDMLCEPYPRESLTQDQAEEVIKKWFKLIGKIKIVPGRFRMTIKSDTLKLIHMVLYALKRDPEFEVSKDATIGQRIKGWVQEMGNSIFHLTERKQIKKIWAEGLRLAYGVPNVDRAEIYMALQPKRSSRLLRRIEKKPLWDRFRDMFSGDLKHDDGELGSVDIDEMLKVIDSNVIRYWDLPDSLKSRYRVRPMNKYLTTHQHYLDRLKGSYGERRLKLRRWFRDAFFKTHTTWFSKHLFFWLYDEKTNPKAPWDYAEKKDQRDTKDE